MPVIVHVLALLITLSMSLLFKFCRIRIVFLLGGSETSFYHDASADSAVIEMNVIICNQSLNFTSWEMNLQRSPDR